MKQQNPEVEPIGFELSEEDLESINGGNVEQTALAVKTVGGFAIRNHVVNLNGGFAIRNHVVNLAR